MRPPPSPPPQSPLRPKPTLLEHLPADIHFHVLLQSGSCASVLRREAACRFFLDLSRGMAHHLSEELWQRLLLARWPVEGPALERASQNARLMYRNFATTTDVMDLSCVDIWRLVRPCKSCTPSVSGPPKVLLVVGSLTAGICSWSMPQRRARESRLIGWTSTVTLDLPPDADVREAIIELPVSCYVIHPRTLRCVHLFSGTAAEAETTHDGTIVTYEHGEAPVVVSGEFDKLPWDVHIYGGLSLKPVTGASRTYECTASVVTVGDEGEDGLCRGGLARVLRTVLAADADDVGIIDEPDDEFSTIFGWI